MSENWYRKPDGTVRIEGRYDGPELRLEPSANHEVLVSLIDAEGWHTWGYFNVHDLQEALLDVVVRTP